jgi:hypothetical protein
MDASPLAQLNNRQQQYVMSPIDDVASGWTQQRQPVRPNPLQRGPFARSYNSSYGSFSSGSSSSYTSATSISGSGYFDVGNRSSGDLLSPMASLAADLSANFNLDSKYYPLFMSNNSISPRLPTPRRSLLPSLSFGSQFGGRQAQRPVSPDEHTSSSIDVNSSPHSPLPHKVPSSQHLAVHSGTALQNITYALFCLC